MSYLVLARKYRPRDFAGLVGQEHVVQALANALSRGRLHHAYLFTGTRGVGKTTVSRILAKSLNCTGPDGQGGITATPCGVCAACRDIDAGRHVDYVELDAASNRGVEEIGRLLDQAVYKPVVGRFKVYMIDEVHMLSNHAFNAMLKTLEEPPEYLKFVLATTDPQKVPPTVLSRCLQFNLRPMALHTLEAHLADVLAREAVDAEAGALRLIARAAHGSMRDALSLADQAIAYGAGALAEDGVRQMLGAVDRGHAVRLVEALARRDGRAAIDGVDGLRALGLSAAGTLEEMAALLQQMAIAQAAPGALDPTDPDAAEAARLAPLLAPDETQLLYSIVLHGRAEIALAPDEYSGLVMVLLRLLAFAPAGAGEGEGVAGGEGGTTGTEAARAAGSAGPGRPTPPPAEAAHERAAGQGTSAMATQPAPSGAGVETTAPARGVAAPPSAPGTPAPPTTTLPARTPAAAVAPAGRVGGSSDDAGAALPAPRIPAALSEPPWASAESAGAGDAATAAAAAAATAVAEPGRTERPGLPPAPAAAAASMATGAPASGPVVAAAVPPPAAAALAAAAMAPAPAPAAASGGAPAAGPTAFDSRPPAPAPVRPPEAGSGASAALLRGRTAATVRVPAARPAGDASSGARTRPSPAGEAPRAAPASAALRRHGPARAMPEPPPWLDAPPAFDGEEPGYASSTMPPPDAEAEASAGPLPDRGAPDRSAPRRAAPDPAASVHRAAADPSDAPPDADPAPPPALRSPLGDRWQQAVRALVDAGRVTALTRELALQSECLAIDEPADAAAPCVWRLRVERDALRSAAHRERLQAALAESVGRAVQLEVELGATADTPARRDAAERERRQRDAEQAIRDDPVVRGLLDQYPTARIVPGTVRPA